MLGIDLEQCCRVLRSFSRPPGRLNLIPAVRSATIIDSSWNASPRAVAAALDTLGNLPAERRIAFLGCMMALGDASASEHRAVGRIAARCTQLLVTVGPEARLIAEEARAQGMPEQFVQSFDTAEQAGEFLKESVRAGDVVLVKGSRSLRLERLIELLMDDPEQADRLLVRYGPQAPDGASSHQ